MVIASYYEVRKSCPYPSQGILKALINERKKRSSRLGGGRKVNEDDEETQDVEEWINDAIERKSEPAGALHEIEWFRVCIIAERIDSQKTRVMLTFFLHRLWWMKQYVVAKLGCGRALIFVAQHEESQEEDEPSHNCSTRQVSLGFDWGESLCY